MNKQYPTLVVKRALNERSMARIKGGIAWGGPTIIKPKLAFNIKATGEPAPTNPPSPD